MKYKIRILVLRKLASNFIKFVNIQNIKDVVNYQNLLFLVLLVTESIDNEISKS